jgi:hypothetical protein
MTRKHFSPKIKNKKLEQGETKWFYSQDESILCVALCKQKAKNHV